MSSGSSSDRSGSAIRVEGPQNRASISSRPNCELISDMAVGHAKDQKVSDLVEVEGLLYAVCYSSDGECHKGPVGQRKEGDGN